MTHGLPPWRSYSFGRTSSLRRTWVRETRSRIDLPNLWRASPRRCPLLSGLCASRDAIRDSLAAGWTLTLPLTLALKAKALYLANRASEALETIKEAEALVERSGERWWSAELHRLKGVFLAAMGADETEIEASFCEAIRIAREQKSVSFEKRAEATYAEHRSQKKSAPGALGFRLPL